MTIICLLKKQTTVGHWIQDTLCIHCISVINQSNLFKFEMKTRTGPSQRQDYILLGLVIDSERISSLIKILK